MNTSLMAGNFYNIILYRDLLKAEFVGHTCLPAGRYADATESYGLEKFFVVRDREGKYNNIRWIQNGIGGENRFMIRAFNKHYRKAIDLIEDSSTSEKMEIAERVIEWFRELPEEYVISLAMFFNEVIDDLGDDSLEKINLRIKGKKKEEKEEKEEEEEEDLEEDEFEEDDYDDEDKEDY